jgi:catalase
MDDPDRDHLVANIVAHAGDGVTAEIQARVVEYWTNVAPELGARVAAGLGISSEAAERAA